MVVGEAAATVVAFESVAAEMASFLVVVASEQWTPAHQLERSLLCREEDWHSGLVQGT